MLFADSETFGTFKGFSDRGLEFAAEMVAPYNASMLEKPQLGQFLLIELASSDEAALGRITRFVPSGLLASSEGEDYVNTMQRRQQIVPEDIKVQRLKYRVQVKLLGAVRELDSGGVHYVPSQRRLPHLGARVALPSPGVLKELCSLSKGDTNLGYYALGEFIYCGAGEVHADPIFRSIDPALNVTFNIHSLIARRSVVFARAGYGKSNLIKFLLAELYRGEPKTEGGLPVGTIVFDADGEYFWPDAVRNRPGLCDVPHLQKNKLVVFTNRRPPDDYYGSWKLGEVKLDIRELPARDVIGIAISADRQQQENVLKLRSVSAGPWREMVDLIHAQGLQAPDVEMGRLLGYSANQIAKNLVEIGAARSNMYGVVRALHDPNSRLLAGTLEALRAGSVVVVDISLLSSGAGNMLAGLLLRRIFSNNQENFTSGPDNPIIPTIVVVEEAQSVLGRNLDETSPFVEWVKEGRKYDLGAILITQQPGSMAPELLSQADNWFCFHLLSEGDASTLGKYNSHFSDDILSHLIGEPIAGNCYMWSAPRQPFVLPVRVRDFGSIYKQYINKSADAAPLADTRAQEVSAVLSAAAGELTAKMKQILGGPEAKWVRVAGAAGSDDERIGIYTGQLYHFIKKAKPRSETRTEDQLKPAIMELIFGLDKWDEISHEERSYYAVSPATYREALGKLPNVKTNVQSAGQPRLGLTQG